MRYIIIAHRTQDSITRGTGINRELYKISRPNPSPNDVTKFFLPSYVNGSQMALGFEDTDYLPVSNELDVTTLKNILSEDATQQELEGLEMYLTSLIGGVVYFKDIIPSGIVRYTEQEMIDLNWNI